MFFYELGEEARVVEIDDGTLVGFMLAFRAKPHDSEIGYVHLIGIHPEHRRKGVARLLYAKFEEACRARGCSALKAITTHGNEGSVRFHAALGFKVSNVEDYAGPGRARIVFQKGL